MASFNCSTCLSFLYLSSFVRLSEGFLSTCEHPPLKPKKSIKDRLVFFPGEARLPSRGRYEVDWRINQVEITNIVTWFPDYLPPGASNLSQWKCLPNTLADVKGYIAVVLRGFSFSHGPSHPHMVGFNYKAQRYATESQLNFLIKPLEDLGYVVHVFSATFSTEFTDKLMTLFGKRLKSDIRSDWQKMFEPFAETLNAFESAASVTIHASKHAVTYQTVTVLRHDVSFQQNVASLVLGCREFCVPFKSSGFESYDVHNSSGLVWQTMHGGYLGCFLDMLDAVRDSWGRFALRLQEFMQRIDRTVNYLVDDSLVDTSRKHPGLDAERPLFTTIGQCKERFPNTSPIKSAPDIRPPFPWKCKPNSSSQSEHRLGEEAKQSIAVILRGASFRSSRVHQGNYMVGFDPDLQMIGTQSILDNLIEPLEALGYTVDVFSSTYTTAFTYMIVEKLSKYLRADLRTPWMQTRFKQGQYKGILQVIFTVFAYAQQQKVAYRIVTMLRHDMQLKQNVASQVLACEKFCVPFRDCGIEPGDAWPFGKKARVPDPWQTMPWKIFECMLVVLTKLHEWPYEMIGRHMARQIGEDKIDFFDFNFKADSDPSKYPNPYYKFCSRPEGGRVWVDPPPPYGRPPRLWR